MDRQETIYNNAERFAEYYYNLASRGEVADLTPHDRELLAQGKGAFVDFYSDAFRRNLENDYKEGEWDDNKAERLNKTKPYDGMVHVLYGGKGPEQKHEEAQFDKFKELVADGAWYNKKPGELSAWANNNGYSWKNAKDRQRFWDDLHKFDIAYNRGKIVEEELGDAPLYEKAAMLAYPGLLQEAQRQSLTGDFDDSKANRQALSDFGYGSAMLMLPAKFGRINLGGGLAGTALTGAGASGIETAHQLTKNAIDDKLPVDAGDIMMAGGAAATVPGLVTLIQGAAAQGGSMAAKQFGRGMMKGARGAMDPGKVERNDLKKLLEDAYNYTKKVSEGSLEKKQTYVGAAEDVARSRFNEAREKLRLLGFDERQIDGMIGQVTDNMVIPPRVSTPVMLGVSNDWKVITAKKGKPAKKVDAEKLFPEVFYAYDTPPMKKATTVSGQLGPEGYGAVHRNFDELYSAFPQKGNSERSLSRNGVPYTLGLLTGSVGSAIGGAVEPTLKLDPMQAGNSVKAQFEKYKQSEWYNSLPEQKKNAIEAAFKKVMKERKGKE
jgi:hypothetical protein